MTVFAKRLLLWTPRLLTIAFAIFLSLFALDVFNEKLPFGTLLLRLLIHLLPTFFILLVLLFAWRWELVGVVLFAGLGILYWLRSAQHPSWVLAISGPLLLTSALFLLSYLKRDELHGEVN